MTIESYLKRCQEHIQKILKKKLPSPTKSPQKLHQAMSYSVLNGGKRLRAAFVYASGECFGAKKQVLDDIAAAIEMIHTFSLIHDDLPALDNDDLRRGKPSCHKAFDEATAILAGDALQSLAYEIIASTKDLNPEIKLEMIRLISQSIGSQGMIGGELLDLEIGKKGNVTLKELKKMYFLKTGCLLSASILLGAMAGNCKDQALIMQLKLFSENIGLAFQIHDDIIGIESDTKTLGKQQGKDLMLNKPVYPVLVGMDAAKREERILYKKALKHLSNIKTDTLTLKEIAAYIIQRNN